GALSPDAGSGERPQENLGRALEAAQRAGAVQPRTHYLSPSTSETPMTPTTPYQSFPNSFRRDLLAGKRLIGCWSSLSNAITTEVLGVAGFDWILLDGEHSPNDVATFIPQLMALKDSASAPVVRPSCNNTV